MLVLLLAACGAPTTVGDFSVVPTANGLDLRGVDGGTLVADLRFAVGTGDETLEMQTGAYRVVDGATAWTALTPGKATSMAGVLTVPLRDEAGADVASVVFNDRGNGVLAVSVTGTGNRVRWDAACTGDDAFAGLGAHAMDVDHAGQAFPLWVAEPGIGKRTDEDQEADWILTGTRHATSYPVPFLLRPEPVGILASTAARVDVDLCTDARWRLDVWEGATGFYVLAATSALDVVRAHALAAGTPAIPPDWALAPWIDAVGGAARVREVAATLRAAGAPTSVIWTEDWKGAEETAWGYHLLPEWELDETLYPDASALDVELEAAGFKWFAYFSPFLVEGTDAWDEAEDFVVRDGDDAPYTFTGVTFEPTSVLDLTRSDARAWAQEKMAAAVAVGFDGWMADYAEWLPPDATLHAADAMDAHNAYPLWWQDVNAELLAGEDAAFFTRSGWTGSPTLSPINWPGDQRTSFDADDGLPSVVPMMIGTAIAGAPLTGSDIAGYQSIGNDPSTKDLWFRWCTLGAFSPVMRTHHGAFASENWQFDTDAETLAHYARYAAIHTALFPYLRGLLATAETDGTPLVLAPFLLYPEERWSRMDAYLLGPSLFVAPVLEAGRSGRHVDLPAGTTWYDWWTGAVVQSGTFAAAPDAIPVFAPAGAIVPLYVEAPDTLVSGRLDGLRTRDDADAARVVRVFAGAAGSFAEADGTTYTTDGRATASGTATSTLASGTIAAGGLTLEVDGDVERTYTLEVFR